MVKLTRKFTVLLAARGKISKHTGQLHKQQCKVPSVDCRPEFKAVDIVVVGSQARYHVLCRCERYVQVSHLNYTWSEL